MLESKRRKNRSINTAIKKIHFPSRIRAIQLPLYAPSPSRQKHNQIPDWRRRTQLTKNQKENLKTLELRNKTMQALQSRKPNQIKTKQHQISFLHSFPFLEIQVLGKNHQSRTTNSRTEKWNNRENEKTKANQNSPYFFLFQLLSLRENPRLEKREPNPNRSRIEHLKTLELRNVRRSIRTGKREGQMRLWLVN